MTRQKLFACVFLLAMISTISTLALAQKNEVALTAGGTVSPDSKASVICPAVLGIVCPSSTNVHTAAGFSFQANFARRIVSFKAASLSAEFPLLFVPNREVSGVDFVGGRSFRNSSFFFTPSAKLTLLPSAWISPFASVGGGLAHYGKTSDENKGALQFGGGVDIKTPLPFLGIRGEVRDLFVTRPNFEPDVHQHNIFAGGGLVFHF